MQSADLDICFLLFWESSQDRVNRQREGERVRERERDILSLLLIIVSDSKSFFCFVLNAVQTFGMEPEILRNRFGRMLPNSS